MEAIGIRDLFGPLLVRLIAEGVNVFDIERVMKYIDKKSLLESWCNNWCEIGNFYESKAKEVESYASHHTLHDLYRFAALSYRAATIIHFKDMDKKKELTSKFLSLYRKSLLHSNHPVESVEVPFQNDTIPGYLHLPQGKGPLPCCISFGGIDSGKEEVSNLALPFLERGIACFVLDLPGSGESLYFKNFHLRISNILEALSQSLNILSQKDIIYKNKIGVCGGCLGANFAYRFAVEDERVKFCATWMPFFSLSDEAIVIDMVPAWLREGAWIRFLTGCAPRVFRKEMSPDYEKIPITTPFYVVHAPHDIWSRPSFIEKVYKIARGKKEMLIVPQPPIFTKSAFMTHPMPAAEQIHWVMPIMVDWIWNQVK